MTQTPAQRCPICAAEVRANPRYPRYLCGRCVRLAVSVDGRPLAFYNVDMSGGCAGKYTDTGEAYAGHACFVAGVRCVADEGRFGGIVIEPAP